MSNISLSVNCVFSNCDELAILNIPNSVTILYEWAFCDCSKITKIKVPIEVQKIFAHAFYNCYSLKGFIYSATKTEWENINKGVDWGFNIERYIVRCLDGDIVK